MLDITNYQSWSILIVRIISSVKEDEEKTSSSPTPFLEKLSRFFNHYKVDEGKGPH